MVQATRVQVDVISIAEALRNVAALVEKYPAEDGGVKYPTYGVQVSIIAADTDAVYAWAEIFNTPVKTHTSDTDTVTYLDARVDAVTIAVHHIEEKPRELHRPKNLTAPDEALEPVSVVPGE